MSKIDARRIHWQWLDRVSEFDVAGRSLVAEREIGREEWYLEHHYPGFPVVPGVFIIEAMAHALAVLRGALTFRELGLWHAYVLAMAHEVRFYSFAQGGDTVSIAASLLEGEDTDSVEGRVLARVGTRKIARARLSLHRLDSDLLGANSDARDPFQLGAYVRMLLTPQLEPILTHAGRHEETLHG